MNITLTENSRISSVDFSSLEFGQIFSDHMFVCDYVNEKWSNERILPYSDIKVSPSSRVFHYGQAIFEGMKAYKDDNDGIWLFRPYVRPFVFASEPSINASEANAYKFMIICTPAKSYYENQEIWVKIEEKYSRAARGGVGYAKAAGNYAAQFYPTQIAKDEGFQQIIWTDSNNHNRVEEAGTMNLFFKINDTLITSPTSDSILDGVTRKSIIEIAKSINISVEERDITVDELLTAYKSGTLKEIFGTGTAVTVLPISGFGYRGKRFSIISDEEKTSDLLKIKLNNIQYAKTNDFSHWQYKIT